MNNRKKPNFMPKNTSVLSTTLAIFSPVVFSVACSTSEAEQESPPSVLSAQQQVFSSAPPKGNSLQQRPANFQQTPTRQSSPPVGRNRVSANEINATNAQANKNRSKPQRTRDTSKPLPPRSTSWSQVENALPAMIHFPTGTFKSCSMDISSEGKYVRITHEFEMMATEVTQDLWDQVVMERLARFRSCSNCAMDSVSWHDAVDFANLLSISQGVEPCYERNGDEVTWPQGLACKGWRLPTDLEWEYAARSGGQTAYTYAGSSTPNQVSWFLDNANRETHPVAQKQPNQSGLYDMSGNVWEWVWERMPTGQQYSGQKQADFSLRIRRGGSWSSGANNSEVCSRGYFSTTNRNPSLGVRLVRTVQK